MGAAVQFHGSTRSDSPSKTLELIENAAANAIGNGLDSLAGIAGNCYKLLTSPIPPTYQRHVTRGMLVWLAALPLALPQDLGLFPVLFAVSSTSYLTLGIDEIAIQHEESFSVLP